MTRPGALGRLQIGAIADSTGDLAEQARAAEAAGVDCVWAVELFRSSVTQAMWLAASTERIGVATGISWAFTRSPMILALSALDIDEVSGGRFRLGLGAGVKRLNETWHGVEYGRPAPHLRETVEATRLIMEKSGSGEPIRYRGSYHEIEIKGWHRPHAKARDSVPIYTAAVQKGMARVAGDVADGMIGHPMCSMRLARRGPGRELRARPRALLARPRRVRLPAHRLLCDLRRRGGGDRGRPQDGVLLRHRANLRAAVGDARLRRRSRGGRRCVQTRRLRRDAGTDPRRDGRHLHRGRPARQGARAGRGGRRAGRRDLADPADLLPRPGELDEYQRRIVEAFAPGGDPRT